MSVWSFLFKLKLASVLNLSCSSRSCYDFFIFPIQLEAGISVGTFLFLLKLFLVFQVETGMSFGHFLFQLKPAWGLDLSCSSWSWYVFRNINIPVEGGFVLDHSFSSCSWYELDHSSFNWNWYEFLTAPPPVEAFVISDNPLSTVEAGVRFGRLLFQASLHEFGPFLFQLKLVWVWTFPVPVEAGMSLDLSYSSWSWYEFGTFPVSVFVGIKLGPFLTQLMLV